ncbi:MAG: hypothetical protein ACKKMV_02755 [Candidatus Nealsonbacteria bacterium]|nr:MAG: hypothetical protein IB617_02815 [Candidatus Nealsonbacteria bacterium]
MKNYPKIVFKYSWIYDQNWKEWIKIYKKKVKNYPSTRKILNYIKKIERLWRKEEKKVLQELSKITHLQWKEKSIICYVVGKCRPFSVPLTMSVYENYPEDYFIDVLIHELIHNLFYQNYKRTEKGWEYIYRKYKKESGKTKHHILLHAIHSHIYLKFYDKKRLKRDIDSLPISDYKRSWQIVQKEGYQNIITEFVKRIK